MSGTGDKNLDKELVVRVTLMKRDEAPMAQLLVAAEVGQHVKLPTPYEISDVYLESEYQQVHEWVKTLKAHWSQLGATLMDAKFYYRLLDEVIEEIGEQYIVQIVTDNEAAIKVAGK
ncbi:hypothetical protein REPUB_Repub12eG0120600 [Reevesia pubescens]